MVEMLLTIFFKHHYLPDQVVVDFNHRRPKGIDHAELLDTKAGSEVEGVG